MDGAAYMYSNVLTICNGDGVKNDAAQKHARQTANSPVSPSLGTIYILYVSILL